ncbi:MAG: AAA family ATPase [Synechococcaceae cyanobacterium SM2_3_2]|nr:AAA family ATPase [Synechococcaceae cyanobacterium SM2_3_2]
MSFYIAPSFLNAVTLHITKNYLDLPNVRVPLLLGIHGRKGEGKSFQCDLIFERMKIHVIHISGGELESPDAGDSSRMVRFRYREASDHIRKNGQMCVLMINDIDAGAGRMNAMTQYTVNTQLVNVTLMNIADNPTNVQLPGSYDPEPLRRVPIIVTGNDLSTLYAPLIRDGRMAKYFWDPTRDDRIGIVKGIFETDQLSNQDIERLVDTFPQQSIDFFGAIRARLYDEQILQMVQSIGIEKISDHLVKKKGGQTAFHPPHVHLQHLIDIGYQIQAQSQQVQNLRLSEDYLGLKSMAAPSVPSQGSLSSQSQLHQQPNGNLPHLAHTDPSRPPSPASPLGLDPTIQRQIQQILSQGYEVGIEHVDKRRYKMNSWKSCGLGHLRDPAEATNAVQTCLSEFRGEYVRLVGVNPQGKKRMMETIIQRP